jgi:recombination protein RecR
MRFAEALAGIKRDVHKCPICFGLSENPEKCEICANEDRDSSIICVVENAKDIMVMEKVRGFRGVYHVLGGALSPIDNVTVNDLNFKELVERVRGGNIKEVIIATNPSVEGEATAMYLGRLIKPFGIKVTRLAYGLPVGATLEYADSVTLLKAIEGRTEV